MSLKQKIVKEILDLARHLSVMNPDNKFTSIQLRTISFIAKQGRVKSIDIAKEFLITPATVTTQVDSLVKNGWIKRTYSKKDRRVILLSLTNKAEKELPIEIKKAMKNYDHIFNPLTKKEEICLLKALKKLHRNAHR